MQVGFPDNLNLIYYVSEFNQYNSSYFDNYSHLLAYYSDSSELSNILII